MPYPDYTPKEIDTFRDANMKYSWCNEREAIDVMRNVYLEGQKDKVKKQKELDIKLRDAIRRVQMKKPKLKTVDEVLAEPVYSEEQKRLMRNAENVNWEIRYFVARNSSTSLEVLQKLANDRIWEVRRGVARNSNTPIEILEMLAKEKCICVRIAAKKTLQKRQEGSDEKT